MKGVLFCVNKATALHSQRGVTLRGEHFMSKEDNSFAKPSKKMATPAAFRYGRQFRAAVVTSGPYGDPRLGRQFASVQAQRRPALRK